MRLQIRKAKLTLLFLKLKMKRNRNFEIKINMETVEQVNSVPFLRLIIDKDLSWKQHINKWKQKYQKCQV